MSKFLLLFYGLFVASTLFAQQSIEKKGRFFFYWGYNRAQFTNSDFHISGEGYDLTFQDVTAADSPIPFSVERYFKPGNISKPQYNYRIGYYINDRLSLSVGLDHMKYYMNTEQNAKVSGYVDASRDKSFAGTYDGSAIDIPWRLLWFHHSDGLNYTSAELEYNLPIWVSSNSKFSLEAMGNVGLGIVIPKTYVMILNEEVDNKFHIAGGGPSAKVGGRFNFFNYFFLETALKSGYVFMPSILVNDKKTAKANQHFGWTQFYGAIGFNIPLKAKKSDKSNEGN